MKKMWKNSDEEIMRGNNLVREFYMYSSICHSTFYSSVMICQIANCKHTFYL